MRYFLNIKFLIFIGLFFNNSFCSGVDAIDRDVIRSLSPVPSISGNSFSENQPAKLASQNRRLTSKWAGWGADKDEEWTVTKDILTAHLNSAQQEEIFEFVQQGSSPQSRKERKDLLKILVLGPIEKTNTPSSQKIRLQSKAIFMMHTSPEDKISLIRALQKKSKEAVTKSLQQAQDLLNQNTNAEDRALIAHSFVSFEDPLQGDDFSEDLKELKKSKRLNGKMIFHAAQAWKEDRLGLLRSWKSLMSFEELRQTKDRVIENFLRLPSATRNIFLGLLPKGLFPNRHKVRGVHKILEADDDLESKIQKIETLSNLQEESPDKYGKIILIIDREAPPAPSSDEASSSEDEESEGSRKILRKKLLKRYLPAPDESEESGQFSESGEE